MDIWTSCSSSYRAQGTCCLCFISSLYEWNPIWKVPNSNLEIMWIRIQIPHRRPIVLASAYRVPRNTAQQLAADLNDLEYQVQFMLANYPGSTLLITGDLNHCMLKAKRDATNDILMRLFSSYGIHVTNTVSSTYRPSGSLLDIIGTNQPELVCRAGVTRCHYGTPHDFTRMILRFEGRVTKSSRPFVESRCISKVDSAMFSEQLLHTDWSSVFVSDSPHLCWLAFQQVFLSQLDTVAPLRRIRVRPRATAYPITHETRQMLQRRRAALTANDRAEYKRLNRLSRAAIRGDCRELYGREIARGDRGGLWRVLRPVIGHKKQQSQAINITPDVLNDFYVSVGTDTAASVPAPIVPVPVRVTRVTTTAFKVQPVDIDTLCAILASMKPSNSLSDDGISITMLQNYMTGLAHPLLHVVNASLSSGNVPAPWKHALITPLPKGKSVTSPKDTRPITILPAIMKLVEKIVQIQLTSYLERHELLSSAQHGYRKKHSTETALHVITDHALQAMDGGQISMLVTLDLSKCFDVVPHRKLLEKLSLYGIDTEWFSSYLSDHTQQVQIRQADGRTVKSRRKPISIGCYQGGALSCIMFMIFSNDVSLHVPDNVKIVQFADDTQIMVSGRKQDLPLLVQRMEAALTAVYRWFCDHSMKLNAAKTQMLMLGTPAMLRDVPPVSLRFCGTLIRESREVKNLGVTIDRHLNFQCHIDVMSRKCVGILIALSHARHVIPKAQLSSVVQALVLSIVRYCISVYGSSGDVQVKRIQKLINFGARVVTGRRRYDHISDAVRQLGWLTAEQLIAYHTACSVRNVMMTGHPESLAGTIGPRLSAQHEHSTRNAHQFVLPRMRTETGKRRLCYRGVKLLNDLDIEPTVPTFRATLKSALRGTEWKSTD